MNEFDKNATRHSGGRPKIGLALGGGGLRGLAHIGVLRELIVAGIPIDYIAGTSMGGLVAAVYASGMDIGDFETEILRISNFSQLVRFLDFSTPLTGLMSGRRTQRYFRNTLGELTFDQCETPLVLVAVDLHTGQEVHLQEGSVIDAMRATMSVPGVFEAVELDGQRLVDGGIVNNVPADVVRKMGADIVIAVDVNPAFDDEALRPKFAPPRFASIAADVWQTGLISLGEMTRLRFALNPPDLLLRPPIPEGVSVFTGFTLIEQTIDSGEQGMELLLPDLLVLLQKN